MKNFNFTLIVTLLFGITPFAVAADSDVYSTGGPEFRAHHAAAVHTRFKPNKRFFNRTRSEVIDGVAHYQFKARVGAGEFDVVRIHRVVRERKPYRPVRTDGAVFMTHGSSLSFDAIFLHPGTGDANVETSVAVYLASNDIDVWGMDFGWTLVPLETFDFSFMQDWGIERDADHTLAAMGIARIIRLFTGQGSDRMNLLGYSYGAATAYAAAGRETQKPRHRRHIRGLIPVDEGMKYADADEISRQNACADAAMFRGMLDSGVYQGEDGIFFGALGALAAQAPDDPSPIVPGFTNYQTVLFFGTNTFLLLPPQAPSWHFVGGTFDDIGLPTGLLYSDPSRWIGLARSLPPYQPILSQFDLSATLCDEDDVSVDDHLAEISVPILYLGAGGGFGTLGDFTSGLTASYDITNFTISLQPAGQRSIDFGHGDMFLADDASTLVWQVLRSWLVDHNGRGHRRR